MEGNEGTRIKGKAMNDEIGNFFIKFTTQGFEDVKKGLNQINENLDKMTGSFDKAQSKSESLFGALVKWTSLVGALTVAYQGLKSVIDGVFNSADNIVDLYKNEQVLGVEAKVLERYGIASRRLGGTQNDAYSFFKDVNDMMSKFQTGQFSKEDAEMFARLGVGFTYNKNMDLAGNRAAYLDALRSAAQNADPNDAKQRQILESLIKQSSIRTLFQAKDSDFAKIMDWADNLRVWSKDDANLQNAQNIKTVKMEWEQAIEDFHTQLMPIMTEVMQALKPLIPVFKNWIDNTLKPWVEANKDNFAKWITDGIDFFKKVAPKILEGLGKVWNILKAIGDMIAGLSDSWIFKLGGSIRMLWNAGLNGLGFVSDEEFNKKYFTPDSTAGGYLGDYLREISGIPSGTPGINTSTQNITNNYGGSVTLTGGQYVPQTINTNNLGSGTAQFATPVMG